MRLLNIQLWPAELGILKGPKSEHCLLAVRKLKKKKYLLKMVFLISELFWEEIKMVIIENYNGKSSA